MEFVHGGVVEGAIGLWALRRKNLNLVNFFKDIFICPCDPNR